MAACAGTSTEMSASKAKERFVPTSAADILSHYRSALLLWDLQQGLGGRAEHLDELSERWTFLRGQAHTSSVPVVWSRHIAPPVDLMDDAEVWRVCRKQGVAGVAEMTPYMQRGTRDVESIPGFVPGPDELVIEKATPSIFVNTPADARLRRLGVGALVIAGVATDIGVEFTARHALALGYFPIVVTDAVGAYSAQAQARGLACIGSFGFLASSAEVAESWATLLP